jgi:hypothetical protein
MTLQEAIALSRGGAKRYDEDGALWLYAQAQPDVVYVANLAVLKLNLPEEEWVERPDAFREVEARNAQPEEYNDWEPVISDLN